jgi:hypothetical protein
MVYDVADTHFASVISMSTIRYISFCFRICMIMNMYEHLLNVRNIQIYLRFKYILYSHLSLIWFIQKVYSVVRKFCTQMTKTYLMNDMIFAISPMHSTSCFFSKHSVPLFETKHVFHFEDQWIVSAW